MITKEWAMNPTTRFIYHVSERNKDGSALRAQVGRCKTWKRQPDKFELTLRIGFRTWMTLTKYNAEDWVRMDPTDVIGLKHALLLKPDCPLQHLIDKLGEEGFEDIVRILKLDIAKDEQSMTERGELFVTLASRGDASHGEDARQIANGARKMTVRVFSYKQASEVVQDYISDYRLSSGQWAGGMVKRRIQNPTEEECAEVAYVSYNGRVWNRNPALGVSADQMVCLYDPYEVVDFPKDVYVHLSEK